MDEQYEPATIIAITLPETREQRARQGYVKSRPFPCKCPLARFQRSSPPPPPPPFASAPRVCTSCVTRISANLRRSRRGLCLSSGEYMQINPMWMDTAQGFEWWWWRREGRRILEVCSLLFDVFEKRLKLSLRQLCINIILNNTYIQCNSTSNFNFVMILKLRIRNLKDRRKYFVHFYCCIFEMQKERKKVRKYAGAIVKT